MAFRSQAIIGIQITDTHLHIAAGRKSESSLTILHLETVPIGDEDPSAILNQVLRSLKYPNVHLALPLASVKHYFFALPPLKKKSAWEIVRRELSQATTADLNTLSFDFSIPKRENRGSEYSILTASRDTVMSFIAAVQRAGKRIQLATSCPYALLSALRHLLPNFQSEICASLHIEETTGLISIFNKGDLAFTRSFSLKSKPIASHSRGPAPSQGEESSASFTFQRIIQETNRSLLFFKQHSHGLMADTLVLSGSFPDSQNLQTSLQENLGVEVHTYHPSKERVILDVTKGVTTADLGRYAVPIGLLLSVPSDVTNLVPETILERGKIFWGRLSVIFLTLSLIVGMAIAHVTLGQQEAILREAVSSQKTTRQKMVPILHDVRKIKKYRQRYARLLKFSKSILHAKRFWTPFFQDVSQIIPDRIFLEQSVFQSEDPLQDIYHFSLTGHVHAETVKTAQNVYQTFIYDLFSSPYVVRGNFSPPEISPVRISQKEMPGPNANEALGTLQAKIEASRQKGAAMTFHLDGTLKTILEKEPTP